MPVDTVSYLTYADAGRRLGVSRQQVWKLVSLGRLPTVMVDGRRYVPRSAVLERSLKPRRMSEKRWIRRVRSG